MHDARLKDLTLACLPVVLALFSAGCGSSKPATTSTTDDAQLAADAAESTRRAVEITTRMLEVYRRAHAYADHATYVEESVLRGEGVAQEIPYYEISLAFQRPNQMRLRFAEAIADGRGARRGFDIACDGELLRAALTEIPDQMVEKPAPAALTAENALTDPLIRDRLFERDLGDVFPQLAMLLNLTDDDSTAIYPHDSHPRLLRNERLADRDCYRVATTHPEGTRVFWIDAETYALHRMELPVDAHRRAIDPDRRYLQLAVRIDFQDVTFDAEIEPATFTIDSKPGAHRVRRFVEPEEGLTAKSAKEEREHEHAHESEGEN
jgi:hypothetical protein